MGTRGFLGESQRSLMERVKIREPLEDNPINFETPEPPAIDEEMRADVTSFIDELDLSLQGISDFSQDRIDQADADAGFPEGFRDLMSQNGLSPSGIRDFEMPFVDFGSELEAEGLEFLRPGDKKDEIIVRDLQADDPREEFVINLRETMLEDGIDLDEIDFAVNRPSTAWDRAPQGLSVADRAKLSAGNIRGSISFLADRFEAVDIDPNNGLVVRENGVWKRVDPGGMFNFSQYMDDPWELARDFADLVDVAPYLKTIGFGAVKGGALGAKAGAFLGPGGAAGGAIVGGIAGAGAAGVTTSLAISSLGRVVGTYDASPQEQALDAAIDGMLSMAGQGIVAGARPSFGLVRSGLKKFSEHATPGVKNILAVQQGHLTGVGFKMARIFQDRAPQVMDNIKRFATPLKKKLKPDGKKLSGVELVEEIQMAAQRENTGLMKGILQRATQNHTAKYGKMLDELVNKAGAKNASINFKTLTDDVFKSFDDLGLGRVVQEKGRAVFRTFDAADIPTRAIQGRPVEMISQNPQTMQFMQQLTSTLDGFSRISGAKGQGAARALTTLNRQLNALADSAYAAKAYDANRIIAKVSAQAKNATARQFDRAGLGKSYRSLNEEYTKYANAVNLARNTLKKGNIESLVNKVLSKATPSADSFDFVNQLVELGGRQSSRAWDQMITNELARAYAPVAPKLGLMQIAKVIAATINPKKAVGAAALLAASSPNIAGAVTGGIHKATAAASRTAARLAEPTKAQLQMSGALRQMGSTPAGKRALNALLSDTDAVRALTRSTLLLGREPASTQIRKMLEDMEVRNPQEELVQ